MSWKPKFDTGVAKFRNGELEEALRQFSGALEQPGGKNRVIYDSRAAVYEKMENYAMALADTKQAIKLAMDRWQGYARAARLFLKIHKYEASLRMIDLALDRVKPEDETRRVELLKLKEEARRALDQANPIPKKYIFAILPVELVAEIFTYVVDGDPAALIRLLRINQHWRGISWNTPALWDTLTLSHKKPSKKAQLWLKRSKGRIRTLVVGAEVTEDTSWSYDLLRSLKWEHLRHCHIVKWDLVKFLTSLSASHAIQNFTSLEVHGTPVDSFFAEGTKWERLTLGLGSFLPCSLAAEHLTSLVSLTLRTSINGDILDVIRVNPMLKTLIIHLPNPTMMGVQSPKETVTLPHLTHVELLNWVDTPTFLSNILCPKLQYLRVQDSSSMDEPLIQLAHRVIPECLTTLILQRVILSANHLTNLLLVTPHLKEFELRQTYNVANTIVDALATPSSTGAILCPELWRLNLSSSVDLMTGPLVRLIKQRNLPQTGEGPQIEKIASLTMDECPSIEASWLSWFREHVPLVQCIYVTKKEAKRWRRQL
ncbi:hypothetical protein BDN72DRAFT_832945 [Pluteus cervinus]|uniref:Uncharacterized protein n=1 Tax=Pluteus cervinus TaxID=181527 RepID=A0ACD3BAG2_9AGAR|nr:hypothetical protein BDN72DRAFT_832945 [Pluteus cervinus]